ncbi:MAG: 3-hydroxyacyl-CoA dehydrogenase, partial [Betaproteobacteria bacterium]|nr:3-hydroxyacyl-CoA dehydrogenase [Betaproteobacteria bacterium]
MGSGITQVAAQAGHPVRLFDIRIGAAERARDAIGQTLAGLAAKGRIDAVAASEAAARIAPI